MYEIFLADIKRNLLETEALKSAMSLYHILFLPLQGIPND